MNTNKPQPIKVFYDIVLDPPEAKVWMDIDPTNPGKGVQRWTAETVPELLEKVTHAYSHLFVAFRREFAERKKYQKFFNTVTARNAE